MVTLRHDVVSLLKLSLSMTVGAVFGSIISMLVVMAFAAMILTPFFNLYYAILFFIAGAVHLYKMVRKNKISLQMNNNEAGSSAINKKKDSEMEFDSDNTRFFSREPIFEENQALYKPSLLLSDE